MAWELRDRKNRRLRNIRKFGGRGVETEKTFVFLRCLSSYCTLCP